MSGATKLTDRQDVSLVPLLRKKISFRIEIVTTLNTGGEEHWHLRSLTPWEKHVSNKPVNEKIHLRPDKNKLSSTYYSKLLLQSLILSYGS